MTHYAYARNAKRIGEPIAEPVTLAQAKQFLRIDGAQEDTLIADMIKAARITAEEYTAHALITQSWQLCFDDCTPTTIALPYAPVQSITRVYLKNALDEETTVSAAQYDVNSQHELVLDAPLVAQQIVIEYVAGYGDSSTHVPSDVVQAILLHVAYLYEHRDSLMPPASAKLCYDRLREVRL